MSHFVVSFLSTRGRSHQWSLFYRFLANIFVLVGHVALLCSFELAFFIGNRLKELLFRFWLEIYRVGEAWLPNNGGDKAWGVIGRAGRELLKLNYVFELFRGT